MLVADDFVQWLTFVVFVQLVSQLITTRCGAIATEKSKYRGAACNARTIKYVNNIDKLKKPYEATFDTSDLKLTLETSEGQHIVVSFGNHRAAVIKRNDISNIIPEIQNN
jgi:hypothetical protein